MLCLQTRLCCQQKSSRMLGFVVSSWGLAGMLCSGCWVLTVVAGQLFCAGHATIRSCLPNQGPT